MATQTTVSTAATTTYLNKTYYDKKLLANARTKFVHAKYGQKRPIPRNGGKTVEFRRWELFDPDLAINGLTEGFTPASQALSQTHVEATVKQYGAYVEISDLLDATAIDDAMGDSAELLGEQLGTVLEHVTRNEMNSGNTVQHAGGNTKRLDIEPTDVLSTTEIRKAVRTLKKNKARMFSTNEKGEGKTPHFICICSPDAVYDLQNDDTWKSVSQYSNKEAIYSGEIGRMFNTVFVESTEAKVFAPVVQNAVKATVTGDEFVLKNTPTDAEVEYLSKGGNKLYINGVSVTLDDTTPYTPETNTVKLSESTTVTANHLIYSQDAGKCDSASKICCDVHSALVFGKDAYGTVDIGSGTGNVQSIVKPFGSAGTADPLNQRATVGAKIMAYTAKILNDNWIVRIEHGVSA
jgi:N4-gp56 family major capsid protein